ncbi:MAG: hypothetical protein JRH19_22050, partial [Deltaproteobacteria bacterium]|nr:hypothetical protein [Deltaproteobacteria bacterium]
AISSFGEDAAGELYLLGYGTGKVYAIVPEPGAALLAAASLATLAALGRRRAR